MISIFFNFPKRYVFALMGFLTTMVGYMMRITVDLTFPLMVNGTAPREPPSFDLYSCPDLGTIFVSNQSVVESLENLEPGLLNWDEQTQSSLRSAFSGGYIMTQFLSGMMADQHGGKKIMGISFLILSFSTFVTPFSAKYLGPNFMYVLRLISGMTSGPIIPVMLSMMSKWVPTDERTFTGSVIFPGALLGYVAGSYLGEMLILHIHWELVYYTFGVFGLMWCFLWKYLVFSNPNDHPSITLSEKIYLNDNVTSLIRSNKYDLDPLPWKAYLRCRAVWCIVIAYIGREWAFNTFTKQVPQYLEDVMRLDMNYTIHLKYMPTVCMWLASLLFGFTSDISVKRGYCSVKNARRLFTSIAGIGVCISLILIMYSGCSPTLAVFFMFIGMCSIGAYYSGCMVTALDVTPNYAGAMIGIIDNISINSVLLLPKIISLIVTDALQRQWRISFWIVIIILAMTLAIYFYNVQTEQVWWDDVRKNGYPIDWKHGLIGCEGLIDFNGQSIYMAKKSLMKNES